VQYHTHKEFGISFSRFNFDNLAISLDFLFEFFEFCLPFFFGITGITNSIKKTIADITDKVCDAFYFLLALAPFLDEPLQ
jgi:hypothetical protein